MGASFSVGSIVCSLVSDGWMAFPREFLFASAEAERDRALHGLTDERGLIRAPCHALLVRATDKCVLVDAGYGDLPRRFEGEGHQLIEDLRAEGVTPEDVDLVIVTHAHPDHAGGLVRDGRPVFADVPHLVWRVEWEFWIEGDPAATGLPLQLAELAREALVPLAEAGLLELVEPGATPATGLRLLPAPGHTPGQLALEISSEGETVIFMADVIPHPLHAEHPDWLLAVELGVGEAVEKTRREFLGRATRENCTVAGSHLPHPVAVEEAGSGFRLVQTVS
jgi:glyoxylase-like metal-dependent hydrolase (beta-lactamase superfamily II)